jgi:hypothetical protein
MPMRNRRTPHQGYVCFHVCLPRRHSSAYGVFSFSLSTEVHGHFRNCSRLRSWCLMKRAVCARRWGIAPFIFKGESRPSRRSMARSRWRSTQTSEPIHELTRIRATKRSTVSSLNYYKYWILSVYLLSFTSSIQYHNDAV